MVMGGSDPESRPASSSLPLVTMSARDIDVFASPFPVCHIPLDLASQQYSVANALSEATQPGTAHCYGTQLP